MRPVVQFKQFPIRSSDAFVGEYSLVDLSWHHEVVLTFGGDQVKVMGMTQDKYERRFLHWNLQATQAVPFQRGGNFESPCQILRRITDIWSPSSSERHSNWGNMSWSHKCERRIIFENLLGTNAVNFRGVDTFQQLHTSSVPWGERQHRGEVDRHCLALFCWRKAHCCLQIRMIGHFFRNYIWIHSLHAFLCIGQHYSRSTTFRKCLLSTSMTAHNHCLCSMYLKEWSEEVQYLDCAKMYHVWKVKQNTFWAI